MYHTAYFLGGPFDLSKMVVYEKWGERTFAASDLPRFDAQPNAPASIRWAVYRLVHELRAEGGGILIYAYDRTEDHLP